MTTALKYVVAALALACLTPAVAMAGELACSVRDRNLDLDYRAVYQNEQPEVLLRGQGSIALKRPDVPESVRNLVISGPEATRQDFDSEHLQVEFLHPFGIVSPDPGSWKLVMKADQPAVATGFKGTYDLEIRMPASTAVTSYGGQIRCVS